MAFDLESLGGGAGAGLIGTFLAIFGFNRRISKLEDGKQDRATCIDVREACQNSLCSKLETLSGQVEHLTERIDHLINHGRQ